MSGIARHKSVVLTANLQAGDSLLGLDVDGLCNIKDNKYLMDNLSMSDIGNYLDASRAYLENAKNKLAQLGYCCDPVLSNLAEEQDRLDRAYYQSMQGSGGLGYIWYIATAIGITASYLGSYIYSHYTQVKLQSDRLDCLEKYQKIYEGSGFNSVDASAQALIMCEGHVGESTKQEIIQTLKLAIYGGVAIFGLYILNKFINKKR